MRISLPTEIRRSMNKLAKWVRTMDVPAGIVTAILFAAGCRSTEPLVNHWVHSYEEDSPGVLVFRPNTYTFPLSRGRDEMELREYGSVIRYEIAPADGLARDTGSWHLSEDRLLTI